MAFWNVSQTPPKKKQLAEYALENKDKPFVRGLLLCSLAVIDISELEGESPYKDVDAAVINSAVLVTCNITWIATKANGLLPAMMSGEIIKQPKIRAILMFNLFVQFCVLAFLKGDGVVVDPFRFNAQTLRTLFLTLPEEEWKRMIPGLSELASELSKEVCREDVPNLTSWQKQMHTFVPSYVLSFNKDSAQLQVINYPWVFEELLAMLLRAVEE